MAWEVFRLKETGGRNAPFVSVGRGMLSFSKAACDLINDNGGYKYGVILTDKIKGKTRVAVRFLTEYENESIPVTRKHIKGKQISGMTLSNKGVVERLFGKDGLNGGMTRFKVEPIDDNTLMIID